MKLSQKKVKLEEEGKKKMNRKKLVRIILFGAPGAGKGTQAEAMEELFKFTKISTGDLIRDEVKHGTQIGKEVEAVIARGDLVPDDIIVNLLNLRLEKGDICCGYIVDGFPRTINQAEILSSMPVEKEVVIYLKVSNEDLIVNRVISRLICNNCGHIYNLQIEPPKVEGKCDHCGGNIRQRKDDKEVVIRKRIQIYRDQTKPVIQYYRNKGMLHEIDAVQSVEEVFNNIKQIIGVLN